MDIDKKGKAQEKVKQVVGTTVDTLSRSVQVRIAGPSPRQARLLVLPLRIEVAR